MRVLIVSGALFASASAATSCAADEMDLCVDVAPSGCSGDEMDLCIDIPPAGSGSCSDDEMDLCPTTQTATNAPTTMAPVTNAPGATNAPVTMAPTTTTTVNVCLADEMDLCEGITVTPVPDTDAVYFSGTFTLNFPGDAPTKTQIEISAKKTLSKKLNVNENLITTTATQSRRLLVPTAGMRRLASTWGVSFIVKAATADKAAIESQVAALKQDQTAFQTEMKTQLKAAGVSSAIADAVAVQTFAAQEATSDGSAKTTTVAPSVETETASNARSISCKLAIAMAFVVAHVASPQVKLFGFASPLSTSSE